MLTLLYMNTDIIANSGPDCKSAAVLAKREELCYNLALYKNMLIPAFGKVENI